uniref:ABC transporter ATP-binding protein n=1 Tax=Schistosoma curassoni TaxID=6186 RepID=A0A183JXE8_9TREM
LKTIASVKGILSFDQLNLASLSFHLSDSVEIFDFCRSQHHAIDQNN